MIHAALLRAGGKNQQPLPFIMGRWWILGAALLVAWNFTASGYGQFQLILPILRTPTTLPELWNAIFFDIEVGNYSRAGDWLVRFWKLLQGSAPEEREKFLLDLYEREGLVPFLRLANHPQLDKVTVKDEKTGEAVPITRALLEQLHQSLQKQLGDEKLVQFYIERLKGRPGERRYAMNRLVLFGEQAVPYLVQVLADPDHKDVHSDIVTVLRYMRGRAVAPLLTVMAEAPSAGLRMQAFQIALEERDPRMIPFLWLAQADPKESPVFRESARRALASMLHRPIPQQPLEKPAFVLGDWRHELVLIAQDYYHRRATLLPGNNLRWWRWEPGKGLVSQTVSGRDFELFASTYWLRKILEIEPDYQPAQVLLVSILLERAVELGGWDKPLAETAPELLQQLTVTDPRLLEQALERALRERKTATVYATLQTLGHIRDARLVQSREGGLPPLVRALSYPDQRVQWQAADTILRTPHSSPFPGSSRVVEVLGRFVASRDARRALLAISDPVAAREIAERFRTLGYEPVVVPGGRSLLRDVAREHADFLVLDMRLPDLPLEHVLSLLHQSPEGANLPVLLWGPEQFEKEAQRLAQRFGWVSVAVPAPLSDAMWQHAIKTAAVPNGPPWSAEQRKAIRQLALTWLLRIAHGELPTLPIEPALPALIAALREDELAASAAQVLAHVRGRRIQEELAQALLTAIPRPAAVQTAIAQALYDHVQANTYLLGDSYSQKIRDLAQKPIAAPVRDVIFRLDRQLAPSPQSTGQQVRQLPVPSPPAAKP